jgi:hypothetical protein
MYLDALEIRREKWGAKQGQLTGKVRFSDGKENAFELNLTPELNEAFMAVIGGALTDSAKALQAKLMANTVDMSPTLQAIESKPE